MVRLRKRWAGVGGRQWRLDTVCWLILGCVAFCVYCHTGGADKCKIRLSCMLTSALGLAAAALCIGWRVRGSQLRVVECKVLARTGGSQSMDCV